MRPDENSTSVSTRGIGAVIVATLAVVVWRVIALALYLRPGSNESALVKTLLAVLGVVFLLCGLVVLLRLSGKPGLLFAWFCICSGLHWGGPLELESGQLRTGLILYYLLVSSVLGSTLLLHFALNFPVALRFAQKKSFVRVLYAPVVAATLFAIAYLISPIEKSDLRDSFLGLFMGLHAFVSNLFGLLVLVLLVVHLFGTRVSGVEKRYVVLMVLGLLIAWVPYLVASSVGTGTDPWNLTVVALPVSFVVALFGIDRVRRSGRHA